MHFTVFTDNLDLDFELHRSVKTSPTYQMRDNVHSLVTRLDRQVVAVTKNRRKTP